MITNKTDISLALAVWLLHDEYDYVDTPNYISATTLLKPLRQIVLPARMDPEIREVDVQDYIARALGHSLHDSIERAWTKGYERSLQIMGYPLNTIRQIRINPPDTELEDGIIPVYLEQRVFRSFDGYTIGGKYDMVTDGIIQDAKSTSAYSWLFGGKDDDYCLQMSLYRWIDAAQDRPKITEEYGRINFIFTDWQRAQARSNPKYPQTRVAHKDIPLMSLTETEAWVHNKLSLIQRHLHTPEAELPECTDEELWRSDPVYKYYADASKTSGRSTRNFISLSDARSYQAEKGGKGVVITVPGEPKRCGYCEAFNGCTQKDRFFSP